MKHNLIDWIKENKIPHEELNNRHILTVCPKCNAHLEIANDYFQCYGFHECSRWKCPQSCYNTCATSGETVEKLRRLYGH